MYLLLFLIASLLFIFDDIVIYSKTLKDHMEHLRGVFWTLRDNQLYVKKEKCSFAQEV